MTAQYADKPTHLTDVTYVLNGGNINGNTGPIVYKNAVVNGNYQVISDIPLYDGYTFMGWNTKEDGKGNTFKSGDKVASGKNNNILYAQWDKNKVAVQVEIIGTAATETYNGSEQYAEDFTVKVTKVPQNLRSMLFGAKDNDVPDDAVKVTLKNGKIAKAARTNAGTTNMDLTIADFEITASEGYTVVGTPTYTDGYVTIKPFKLTVEIKGSEKTIPHDGTEHSVEGFEAKVQGDHPETFDISKVLWKNGTEKPSAAGTEVGSYSMGLNENDFSYGDSDNSGNFDIEYLVTDGVLNITKTNSGDVDPPVDPDDDGEVLDEYDDGSGSDSDSSDDDNNSSVKGVNTSDDSNILLFITILGLAILALLVLMTTRIRHNVK